MNNLEVIQITRQVEPNKKDGFNVKARNETERQTIGNLKQLCLQDDLELADFIFECIHLGFKKHHYPPGNPQRQLTQYQQTHIPTGQKEVCSNCNQHSSVIWLIHLQLKPQKQASYCQTCFSKIPCRFDTKLYKITKDQRRSHKQ